MFEAEQIVGPDLEPTLTDFVRPPFRKFQFSTAMSQAHAARVLEEIVEPPRKFGWPTSAKSGYFEGKVAGTSFKIHRVINFPNSFLPIIEGRFRRDGFATIVTLSLRLVWPAMVVWFGTILFMLWNSVAPDSHLAGSYSARIAVLVMTAVIYFMASVCFAIEMRLAMKRLLSLLYSGPARSDLSL